MKIKIRDYGEEGRKFIEAMELDVGGREVELGGVYNGVGIPTDQGYFGIVMRDSGIEVMLDGVLVWSSSEVAVKTKPKTDRPIAVFDLETTGMSPAKDRIIQFSAVKLDENFEMVDELDISLNPQHPISPGASKVHGFTNKDLVDSPTFERMAPKIKKFLEGCDFCGHNMIRFDLKMLMAEFERHTNFKIDTKKRRLLDTLLVSRKMRGKGPHDLGSCCRHYCGEDVEDAHDGLSDATATAKVLIAMLEREQIGLTQADKISRGIRA
jgi:DNA polymerase III epsilon subunit family exonuclease